MEEPEKQVTKQLIMVENPLKDFKEKILTISVLIIDLENVFAKEVLKT
jgi:hypothetical protein